MRHTISSGVVTMSAQAGRFLLNLVSTPWRQQSRQDQSGAQQRLAIMKGVGAVFIYSYSPQRRVAINLFQALRKLKKSR